MKSRILNFICILTVMLSFVFISGTWAPKPAFSCKKALPVVYVHGGSGSASQYATQAMRWSSNRYPNVVRALDRISEEIQPVNEQMDDFFNAVMAETRDDQIYVIAHSYGVALMKEYLNSSPERTAKIAKFIAIDSASAGENPECPGNPEPVECMGIYRDDNPNYMGSNMVRLLLHGHTQCVTSTESFVEQYKFLTGKEPRTTLVLPEPPHRVKISGRAVLFPDNLGMDQSKLEIWEIDRDTGARISAVPKKVIEIGPTGDWGPVKVNGKKNYELTLHRTDVDFVTHYYFQPFIRSNHLIRLLSSPADSIVLRLTPQAPDHTGLVIIRYKEWWSDQEAGNDTLWVTSTSFTWDDDPNNPTPPTYNILYNTQVAPRSGHKLGIHLHDAGVDKVSTIAPIPVFLMMPSQTAVDIWMPSTEPPDGTITLMNEPRGDTSRPQIINIPNWASEGHRVSIQFNDYVQDIKTWKGCKRARRYPCKHKQGRPKPFK